MFALIASPRPCRRWCRWLAALTLWLGALPGFSRCTAESDPLRLDPQLPYQAERRKPVTHDIDFSVVVTPPYHTRVLKVWLPVPPSDPSQELSNSRWSTFPMEVTPRLATEPRYGNRFAYFEFHDPQGAQIIRHRFQIKVWELVWNLDPEQVRGVPADQWPASFAAYRRSESQAVVVDQRFSGLLNEILPQPGNPLENLSTVMDWVIRDFRYDHDRASLAASSVHALTARTGHCSDYHGFCASMGRVLGYPTRVTYGIAVAPKNSPSHCKLEAYLPPYGWVAFDVSETQKLIQRLQQSSELEETRRAALIAAAKRRLVTGFRENSWFLQTKGTDYDLAPPASQRVPLVRTAYIEADGVPLPEPDPSNSTQREFAWMTVHKYSSDPPVVYPHELRSLAEAE